MQEDWNAEVGRDACGNWQGICEPFSMMTQMREDSDFGVRHLYRSCVCEHFLSSQSIQKMDLP